VFSFLFRHCNQASAFAQPVLIIACVIWLHCMIGTAVVPYSVIQPSQPQNCSGCNDEAKTAYRVHEMASRLYALPPVSFATYNARRPAGNQRSLRFGPRLHQLSQVDLPLLRLLALRYTIFVQISIIQG
jgi:hypothetical protein